LCGEWENEKTQQSTCWKLFKDQEKSRLKREEPSRLHFIVKIHNNDEEGEEETENEEVPSKRRKNLKNFVYFVKFTKISQIYFHGFKIESQ
jgi:hypothetical protein